MKNLIRAAGYNARTLSIKMKISESTVGKWVLGIAYPRGERIIELSKLLGCSTDDILSAIQSSRRKSA